MFCHNCGEKLPDGSKFCSTCGEKQILEEPVVSAQAAAPVSLDEPVVPAAPAAPAGNGKPAAAAPAAPAKPGAVPRKKKSGGKVIIGVAAGIAAVALAVVGAVIGLGTFFTGSGNNNAYAYVSDGTYELITNLDKGQLIEIASSRAEIPEDDQWALANLMKFSPDGKYLYYYTKVTNVEDYFWTGTLCRAEYGRLKQNGKNNDKYIEVIASDVPFGMQNGAVIYGFRLMDDGSVVYMNAGHTLYYYDGEESVRIAKDINVYDIDGAGRIVYITGDYDDGFTLYGVTLDDMDHKEKLASNFAGALASKYLISLYDVVLEDFDNILYIEREDDGSSALYVTGFEKDAEKLAENVEILMTPNEYLGSEKTYFIAESDTALSLYDFVEDPYVGTDAGLSEPREEDFIVPRYSYEMITGQNLSESDYEELYTTCTHRLYWYGENIFTCCSMEDAFNRTWNDAGSTELIYSITRDFIDRFGDMANEDGFIPVTDEVKAALQGIQSHDEQPEREWQWLWLCYRRYQSGTEIDYDAYTAAWNEWYKAENRIALREALQDAENDRKVYTLYCFEDGELTALQENVLDIKEFPGALVFNTPELVTETVKIDEIGSAYDAGTLLNLDPGAENYVLLMNSDQICQMSAGAAQAYAEARENGRATLCFTDQEAYLSEENGALSAAAISGGTVKDFSIVTDDAEVLDVDGSTLYYVSDSHESGSRISGDLYSRTGGDSTCLVEDMVRGNGPYFYDDGVILACTGYSDRSGLELSMINADGEATEIADHITQYIRVDGSLLLYLSDGDLYSYDGGEKNLVQTDADWIWSRNVMEPLKNYFRYAYSSVYDLYG